MLVTRFAVCGVLERPKVWTTVRAAPGRSRLAPKNRWVQPEPPMGSAVVGVDRWALVAITALRIAFGSNRK
jgi:hypothetical protein